MKVSNRVSNKILILTAITFLSACASLRSPRDRMFMGAGIGGAMGAGGGALFSPNEESRGLNALVFGLSGALVGGVVGFLTASGDEPKSQAKSLEERERANQSQIQGKEFVVLPQDELPNFLKSRMSPAVVEEYLEQDSVTEDGSLHEPHKVYRIKRPAELISRPEKTEGTKQ